MKTKFNIIKISFVIFFASIYFVQACPTGFFPITWVTVGHPGCRYKIEVCSNSQDEIYFGDIICLEDYACPMDQFGNLGFSLQTLYEMAMLQYAYDETGNSLSDCPEYDSSIIRFVHPSCLSEWILTGNYINDPSNPAPIQEKRRFSCGDTPVMCRQWYAFCKYPDPNNPGEYLIDMQFGPMQVYSSECPNHVFIYN